jgi:Yip1 domain
VDLFERSIFRDRPLSQISQMSADIMGRARASLRRGFAAGPGGGHLQARIRAILLAPRTEWPVVAQEHADIVALYLRYIMPLAAIPPLCKLIGWSLLFSYIGFGVGLVGALASYALGLAGVALMALIASRLAPLFEGEQDLVQAFKLVAYAATPAWIGGVFRLVPVLAILGMLMSLYSIYLIYTGAQTVMAVPEDRVVGYTVAVVLSALAVFVVTAVIIVALAGVSVMGMV